MYINAGFDDYLTKPIDTTRLENMLIRYLPPDLVKQAEDIKEEEKKEEKKEKKEEKSTPEILHNVLVVHEDIDYLRKVREYLSERYNVVVVKSVEQVLAYLKKHEAELILMDSDIPDPDGVDKAKIIRSHLKEMSQDEITSQVNEFFGEG
jgi:DNA-binding response OmpR family regulator